MADTTLEGMRRNTLNALCSQQVINSILYDSTLPQIVKTKTFEIAKKIANNKNRHRVYIEDWEEALRQVKE